ncbi:MAG: glycosyl hydrolase, partial [Candidatus Solibacter sp.]|nr:glycosyl hydrolase [Candidatus Solibacter sp.]
MRKSGSALLACGAAAILFAAPAFDPAVFSSLTWRSIGPPRGGRSIASAGSPSRPLEYYFGATGGGLWKTADGGLTWRPVTDGQLKSSSVGAVAVSESNPDVVYIGMGETALRGNIMQGDGVYKSIDAGKTWKHMGLGDTQIVSRIRVHPANPDVVYVAALGHPYGPNAERGVFRSKDGGQTWTKILFRNDRSGAVDLCLDPKNPNVLFAAIWDANRTPWSLSSGGPGSGLFKSTDGGDHWTEITRNPGMPQGIIGKIGVAVSGADGNRVYAIVENQNGGVFVSDDAGATWKLLSEDRRLRQRAFYYSRIYADPKAKDTVYVLNTAFFRSTDGGKTYRTVPTPHGDNHDLWIDPANPLRMVQSNDGGANVSLNGGQTWTGQ